MFVINWVAGGWKVGYTCMPATRCARAPRLQLHIARECSSQAAKGNQGWQGRQRGLCGRLCQCVRAIGVCKRASTDG